MTESGFFGLAGGDLIFVWVVGRNMYGRCLWVQYDSVFYGLGKAGVRCWVANWYTEQSVMVKIIPYV